MVFVAVVGGWVGAIGQRWLHRRAKADERREDLFLYALALKQSGERLTEQRGDSVPPDLRTIQDKAARHFHRLPLRIQRVVDEDETRGSSHQLRDRRKTLGHKGNVLEQYLVRREQPVSSRVRAFRTHLQQRSVESPFSE